MVLVNPIGERRPNCVVLEHAVSHSGRFYCFFGYHYHEGVKCFTVGARDNRSGEIVMRHYNEKLTGLPEAEALSYWNTFSEGMKRAPESEEEDGIRAEIEKYLN